jgi:uncharacterized protein YqgV (UPF0045/DUF77 family)
METSVEISMYPLSQAYEGLVLSFLERLNKHTDITVHTNGMSTQVFGAFDAVFSAIQAEIKHEFGNPDKVVFVMKCVNADLSQYEG